MKTLKYCVACALTAGVALGVAGCRNTSGTVIKTDHLSGVSTMVEDNARLAHQVKVVGTRYDEVNGLKRVHITLASERNRRLRVDYRICWFDGNGVELDSNTKTYRNLILEGHDAVTVTGVANSTAAVVSKLRFRETSQAE